MTTVSANTNEGTSKAPAPVPAKGGRRAAGSIKRMPARRGEAHGYFALAVYVPRERRELTGGRPRLWFSTEPGPDSAQTRARAQEAAASLTEQVRTKPDAFVIELAKRAGASRKVPPAVVVEDVDQGETCDAWYLRFAKSREGITENAYDDSLRWRRYVSPAIGAKGVRFVNRADVEGIRDALDGAIKLYKQGQRRNGALAPKSALHVWSVLVTAFKAMVRHKAKELRVREDLGNPCTDVLPPEDGEGRRKHWIRPGEFTALVECRAVPLVWREVHAVACYLYLRPNELCELRAGDVDLASREVSITRAYDQRARKVKTPKTSEGIRIIPVPDALLPLLRRLVEGKSADALLLPILREVHEDKHAGMLRDHLRTAGVERAELFAETATHMAIGFRSWRDTGITWLALADVPVHKMQRRAGHKDIATTMHYVKEVEDRMGRYGEPFPALPDHLVNPEGTPPTTPPEGGHDPKGECEGFSEGVDSANLGATSERFAETDPRGTLRNDSRMSEGGPFNSRPSHCKAPVFRGFLLCPPCARSRCRRCGWRG